MSNPAPTIDFSRTHFQLFELNPAFALDRAQLDQRYRQLQAQVHPDRYAHLPENERRLSLQWATQVNEAYQTLKQPISRARYLLHIQGVNTEEETNTAMPADFLMEQMDWREGIADARGTGDIASLEQLSQRLQRETRALQDALAQQLDSEHDLPGAALSVRKLKFLEKLDEDISNAIEAALG